MNHSVLSSPSNLRNRPTDAADYVLGNTDWTKGEREQPPMILCGSRDQFIEAASLVTKGPAYLSTTISDQGVTETPKIRYSADLYANHYRAGIPSEDVGELSVLHQKASGWDAHLLSALAIRGSAKKARFLRPTADFLRFAYLNSFINRLFKWPDPLDPRNYCPIHVLESWRDKPEVIVRIARDLSSVFHGNQVADRKDILQIIRRHGLKPTSNHRQIVAEIDGQKWTFVGYAATEHADSRQKLKDYRQRTTKPFLDIRDHSAEIENRLLALYRKRVQENATYYGIKTVEASTGLIVPTADYFRTHYENGRKEAARIYSKPTAELDRTRNHKIPGVTENLDRGSAESAIDLGEKVPDTGRENPIPRPEGQMHGGGDGEHDARTRQRLRDLKEARQRIDEWIHLILRLLKLPRWFRDQRAKQKLHAQKVFEKFGDLKRRSNPQGLSIKPPIAMTVLHFPELREPDSFTPMREGPTGPTNSE